MLQVVMCYLTTISIPQRLHALGPLACPWKHCSKLRRYWMCLFQSCLRYKKSPCADHKRQHRAIPVMRRLQWSRSDMPTFWTMTAGSTQQGSRRSFMAAANRRQRQARHPKYGRLPPIRCKILTRRPNSSCF